MWDFLRLILNFFWWRAEAAEEPRNRVWHPIAFLSFWLPVAALLLWGLYHLLRLPGDWLYRTFVSA